ncbi:hypothetical protein KC963_00825 [Candidatus Saccharibacteria bacterium]|nr:hypothetical protein [Candidatus Saccharibacteria bacterium]
MTFLQSAKYVGYGLFGMVLFGMSVNKIFASDITMACAANTADVYIVCSVPGSKEYEYCLPSESSEKRHIRWVCTQDQEKFKKGYAILKKADEQAKKDQGTDKPEKTPYGLSYGF